MAYEYPNIDTVEDDYSWLGMVIGIDRFGPYTIVTYKERELNSEQFTGRILYGVYNEKNNDTMCYASYDAALAGAIAYRNEGCNHHADEYFIRSLGIQC